MDRLSSFEDLGAMVAGISPDSVKSHARFAEKNGLTYSILSDEDHRILEELGFWKMKKMYGREYPGVVRSTLVIDPEGVVRKIWDKVKVKGHAEEVLVYLQDRLNR